MAIPRAIADRTDPRIKAAYLDVLHRVRWRRYPVRRITLAFTRQQGRTVLAGPYRGMRFPTFAIGRGEMVVPQLLGAYERELHEAISKVIETGFDQIIDIGASDGYHAVGLALRMPQAQVHAYERNPFPARVCAALAHENGVSSRFHLHGECTLDALRSLPAEPSTFVLCDCEGGEAELIRPGEVELLRRSHLIVELHEFAAPGVEELMRERFSSSHELEVIHTEPRYVNDYPVLLKVPNVSYMDRQLGITEFRPTAMKWAVMTPRAG
jgi:hypothetical protein